MEPVYRTVVRTALGVFRVMDWEVRTTGEDAIPRRGPAIIAANHIGFLDFVFLGAGARLRGRLVRFMAMHDAFDHWLGGPLLRAMHHIPVDREGDPGPAYRTSVEVLRAGEVLGIHPEGAMSRSFVPQPAKTGAARLALETGAPLIPAAVWGSQRILGRGRPRLPRHIAVTVDFGHPILPQDGEGAEALTMRLMDRIRAMVARASWTYPQQPRGFADRWWLPRHLGGTAPSVEEAIASAREAAERRRMRRAPR